jgi:hypothetical protein
MEAQKKTTYGDAKKRYYEKNKETIAEKEKEDKRWREYYEKNKEAVKRRNLERYYAKQGRTPPAPPEPISPDLPPIEDVRALIKRLQEILPVLTKAERKKRGKSPPATETPAPPQNEVIA